MMCACMKNPLWMLFWLNFCSANYRHFHVDNADICNTGKIVASKTLELGTGAALFELQSPSTDFQPNYRNKAKRCEIHIRAPGKDLTRHNRLKRHFSVLKDTCKSSQKHNITQVWIILFVFGIHAAYAGHVITMLVTNVTVKY
jgi:hypothetical protein